MLGRSRHRSHGRAASGLHRRVWCSRPDRLVLDARERLVAARRQEQLAAQAAEKKGRELAGRQEAAARQAALKKDTERLKYIRSLQARFGSRITAKSAEG